MVGTGGEELGGRGGAWWEGQELETDGGRQRCGGMTVHCAEGSKHD